MSLIKPRPPPPPASVRSTTTTSGRLVRSTSMASAAVAASACTMKSSSPPMSWAIPRRTIGWSSTMSTFQRRPVGSRRPRTVTAHSLHAATDDGTAAVPTMDFQTATDETGSLAHGVQPQATSAGSRREAAPVVGDLQDDLFGVGAEREAHVPRLAVTERVVDRLLGDAIQVRGEDAVVNGHRSRANEATERPAAAGGARELLQRRGQAVGLHLHGEETFGDLPHLLQRLFGAGGDGSRLGLQRRTLSRELRLQALGQERQSGQLATQTIVQFLSELQLFAPDRFGKLAFQFFRSEGR